MGLDIGDKGVQCIPCNHTLPPWCGCCAVKALYLVWWVCYDDPAPGMFGLQYMVLVWWVCYDVPVPGALGHSDGPVPGMVGVK